MTGWNLPPGCEVSHIPGNRPIDILMDREADKYCERCEDAGGCTLDVYDCPHTKDFDKYIEDLLNLY